MNSFHIQLVAMSNSVPYILGLRARCDYSGTCIFLAAIGAFREAEMNRQSNQFCSPFQESKCSWSSMDSHVSSPVRANRETFEDYTFTSALPSFPSQSSLPWSMSRWLAECSPSTKASQKPCGYRPLNRSILSVALQLCLFSLLVTQYWCVPSRSIGSSK